MVVVSDEYGSVKERTLGKNNLVVSKLGLGCMGMTGLYGATNDDEAIATIHRALDLGITFFDTAEVYGPYTNEKLLGQALRGRREGITIATKFGFKVASGLSEVDGSPENVKRVADASLKRLGIDVIDLYYQHRRDASVPIEETVGAMKELVEVGKVRHLGLSEVGEVTLRRAESVYPITALQTEYSLWERDVEALFPVLRELGIGLVPYSPLGRGFLTGALTTAQLDKDDWRRTNPRFAGDNEKKNARLVEVVRTVASRHGVAVGNVALGWILAQGDDVVPIPGTKRVKYLEQNVGAVDVRLTDRDFAELNALSETVAGARNTPGGMALIES